MCYNYVMEAEFFLYHQLGTTSLDLLLEVVLALVLAPMQANRVMYMVVCVMHSLFAGELLFRKHLCQKGKDSG